MSASDHAVRVQGVGKRFRIYHRRPTAIKEHVLARLRGHRTTHEDLWVLRDISLSVAPGEMVGLIGANGSGKSTLLQVISGIYAADEGSVEVTGRLRALLELGAGFNPELTGRENIYLNGSLLGMSRHEITRRFDAIVDFAELDRFIDMPLKTYSSGMQVRLGFATAIHLDPEVLLLDEVLAVGDDHFQRKCLRRVRTIRRSGVSVIFTSHDLLSVEQLCDRVYLLEGGRVTAEGTPADVIARYHAALSRDERVAAAATSVAEPQPAAPEDEPAAAPMDAVDAAPPQRRWGTGALIFSDVTLVGGNGPAQTFRTGDSLTLRASVNAAAPIPRVVFGVGIRRDDGTLVSGPNTKMSGRPPVQAVDGQTLEYRIPVLPLLPGVYEVAVAAYDEDLLTAYDHWEGCTEFRVVEDGTAERFGLVTLAGEWRIVSPDASAALGPAAAAREPVVHIDR